MISNQNIYLDFHCHSVKPRDDKFVIQSLFLHEEQEFLEQENLKYTIGLHPWYADKLTSKETITQLEKVILEKKIIAVGEAGLDKIRGADWNTQEDIFRLHIDIAAKHKLPLIIHSVRTHNDVIKIRKDSKTNNPWVIHLFSGSQQIAEDFIRHNCYISIGHHILDEKSRIQQYLKNIPIERIFLETDDFNIDIEEIYAKAADIYEVSLSFLKKQMFVNLNTLLNG